MRLATDRTSGQDKKYKGMFASLEPIIDKHYFEGLYKTFFISLTGFLLLKYCKTSIRQKLEKLIPDSQHKTEFNLQLATNFLALLIAYPLETVKNRMMVNHGEEFNKHDTVEDSV